MVSSKYLSNFSRVLEMPLIIFEINVILTWSSNCFITDAPVDNQVATFAITFVPIVTLLIQNSKLLQQLK